MVERRPGAGRRRRRLRPSRGSGLLHGIRGAAGRRTGSHRAHDSARDQGRFSLRRGEGIDRADGLPVMVSVQRAIPAAIATTPSRGGADLA